MPKVICEAMTCKFNTSNTPNHPGECLKDEVNFVVYDESEELDDETMDCNSYKLDESKISKL